MITSDDGSGYYATDSEMSPVSVNPYNVEQGIVDKKWTHVVWMNK